MSGTFYECVSEPWPTGVGQIFTDNDCSYFYCFKGGKNENIW